MPRSNAFRIILALVFALSALAVVATAAYAEPRPDSYILPGNAVYPEGIAFEESTGYFFVSSTTDGTIFRGHVKDETASVFLPGGQDGRTFVAGLEVDDGRLFASGGGTGKMFVYDSATGDLIAAFDNNLTATFINDVAVTRDGSAFFTDSLSPFLYRVYPSGGSYAMEVWIDFTGTALTYQPGFNINGIEVTPDGKYLILVQSNTGKLFRVSLDDRQVVEIDTNGYSVSSGDGMLVKGHRLYVVRNLPVNGVNDGFIAELKLSGDYTSATFVGETRDDSFIRPTTLAEARGRVLVVNSQFNRRATNNPILPFTVSSIRFP